MMKYIVIGFLVLINGTVSAQQRIEAFSTAQFLLHNIEHLTGQGLSIEIYDLDAPTQLEDELSTGLSADPKLAEREAKAYLDLLGEDELRLRVEEAYRAELRARELGIDRYPAVVFDGQRVVYGIADLAVALAHFRQWQHRKPQP